MPKIAQRVFSGASLGLGCCSKFYKNKHKVVKHSNANQANKVLADLGYVNPPYLPKSEVTLIKLKRDTVLSRVYANTEDKIGGWFMNSDDPRKLSPKELKEKYALPKEHKYYCDVVLNKGTVLRIGHANKVSDWGLGGGVQFDALGEYVGKFSKDYLIEN